MAMVFSSSDQFIQLEDDLYFMHFPSSLAGVDNVQNKEQNDGKVLVFLRLHVRTYFQPRTKSTLNVLIHNSLVG